VINRKCISFSSNNTLKIISWKRNSKERNSKERNSKENY